MSRTRFSVARLALIAQNTLLECMRQRLFLLLSLVTAALGIAVWLFRDCGFVAPRTKFLLDGGFGALTFFGAVLAIAAAAQSFSGEIEKGTVLAVLARPVWRTEFILGKLAGVMVLLLVFCATSTGLLLGLVMWQQAGPETSSAMIPQDGGHVSCSAVVACGLVQWLRSTVLAALTLLVSSYARSSLFTVVSGFAALVICNLQSVACDACRAAGSGWEGGVVGVIGFIVPDFGLYDVADGVAAGGALPTTYLAGISLYSVAYVGVFGGIAVYCFCHREL
jgi:ABC-type transport system involved in multi-copper enzyme maturation permease subunit